MIPKTVMYCEKKTDHITLCSVPDTEKTTHCTHTCVHKTSHYNVRFVFSGSVTEQNLPIIFRNLCVEKAFVTKRYFDDCSAGVLTEMNLERQLL